MLEAGERELSAQQLLSLCTFYNVGLDAFQNHGPVKQKKQNHGKPKPTTSKTTNRRPVYQAQDEDSQDAENDLLNLISEIIVDVTLKEWADHNRLQAHPEGFHPDRYITCAICGNNVSGDKAWFDQMGYRCLVCQTAEVQQEIPAGLALDQELFYTDSDFRRYLEIDATSLSRLVKTGHLKQRTISKNSKFHCRIFLLAENAGFLPPKSLLKNDWMIVSDASGESEERSVEWYYFDERVAAFKQYGISNLIAVYRKPAYSS